MIVEPNYNMKSDFKSSSKGAEEYLEHFVTPIIDQLISDLLAARPSNVIAYASKWFQDIELKTTKL